MPPPKAASRATWRSSRTRCPRMSARCAAPGCTSSSGLRNGRRSTSTPAGRRRRWRPLRRRAAASLSTTPMSSAIPPTSGAFGTASPRTTCTRTCANLRKLSAAVGAEPGPLEQNWKFAPDIPLALRPQGGSIRVSYPANTITYRYNRKSNTYRRTVSVEGEQSRRVERQADRAEERDRDARQLLAAQRRIGQEPPGGRHHRQGQGVDRHQWPNDQGNLAKEQAHRADQVLRRRRQGGPAHGRADLHPGARHWLEGHHQEGQGAAGDSHRRRPSTSPTPGQG